MTDAAFRYMTGFDNPPVGDPADPEHLWLAYCRDEPNRDLHCYGVSNTVAVNRFWFLDYRKYYLANTGPLVCGFTVYEDFDSYGGGVYHDVTGNERGGHAVLVIGYSDIDNAWICRNSWGAGFGGPAQADGTGGGFFKIGYGECSIDGEAFCGATGVTPSRQGCWRWCNKCQCLAYACGAALGPCAAGGDHDTAAAGTTS